MEIKININNEGNFIIESKGLLNTVADCIEDEYDRLEFIKSLGWQPVVLQSAIELLESEFSRKNWNEGIHKKREELLSKIKQNEIEYYSASIFEKFIGEIEKLRDFEKKVSNKYWKLYEYCEKIYKEKYGDKKELPKKFVFFPDGIKKGYDYPLDYKRKVEKIIEKYLKEMIKK